MRGWSIPLGRWAGVEMRVHIFVPLLALIFFGIGAGNGWPRALALYLLLLFALVVRESARLVVAARLGLRLRAVLLLPIGGMFAYATPESQERAQQGNARYALALAGPLANFATALMLLATVLGVSPNLQLYTFPLVDPSHLVRSLIALQLAFGLLHLLPAYPLDCGRLMRNHFSRSNGFLANAGAAAKAGQALALGAMLAGMLLRNPWLMLIGFFIFIGAQIEDQGVFFQSVVDTVCMREVMLTDFATLSPSDTLTDALSRCVHSLQDEFPVVRGPELVGIISRQHIVDALRADGNGYIQSAMSRVFQIARPEDTLGAAIRRLTNGHGLSLIPVTDAGRVVGIVSVQNLMTSMALLSEQRRIERQQTGD
jgi:Zn-dependent protease/CBS domain-containing protein